MFPDRFLCPHKVQGPELRDGAATQVEAGSSHIRQFPPRHAPRTD